MHIYSCGIDKYSFYIGLTIEKFYDSKGKGKTLKENQWKSKREELLFDLKQAPLI
jgi:hypothetical protein